MSDEITQADRDRIDETTVTMPTEDREPIPGAPADYVGTDGGARAWLKRLPLWLVRKQTIGRALKLVDLLASEYWRWRCYVGKERSIVMEFGDENDGGKVEIK